MRLWRKLAANLAVGEQIEEPEFLYSSEIDFLRGAQDEPPDGGNGYPPGVSTLLLAPLRSARLRVQQSTFDPNTNLVYVNAQGHSQRAGGIAVEIALDAKADDFYLYGGEERP